MTPLIREMASLHAFPENYQWIDCSEQNDPGGFSIDQWAFYARSLPFERTAFVYETPFKYSKMTVFIDKTSESDFSIFIKIFYNDGAFGNLPQLNFELNEWGVFVKGEISEELSNNAANYMDVMSCLVKCINEKTLAFAPNGDRAKNAKRIAKGKKPMYEWRTVEIKPPAPKSTSLGGTHASPRQHDRRGHWRQYKSGKRVWVRNAKVGKASNGTVFHDYKVHAIQTEAMR